MYIKGFFFQTHVVAFFFFFFVSVGWLGSVEVNLSYGLIPNSL